MATLKNLIHRTKLWIQQIDFIYHGKIKIELLVDKEYFLRYLIETKHYLAELVIEPDGFHPHHHVSFMAYDLEGKDTSSYAYCYYDDKESTEDDIFNCLDEAISSMLLRDLS
ncbi:MAG: hypothetical protein NC417_10805 [Candidatus Gastranaerophilales bacterium]|nr:hypothetical protein [Candidatus Gastranaerophilales bacterium]